MLTDKNCPPRPKRRLIIILLAAVLIGIVAVYCSVGYINRDLDHVVTQVILERIEKNQSQEEQVFYVEAHKVLSSKEDRDTRTVTVYLMASAIRYRFAEDGWNEESAFSSVPMALTFSIEPSGQYELKSFWEASDGELYQSSIKEAFPTVAYYLSNLYPSGLLTTSCELQGWWQQTTGRVL